MNINTYSPRIAEGIAQIEATRSAFLKSVLSHHIILTENEQAAEKVARDDYRMAVADLYFIAQEELGHDRASALIEDIKEAA